MPSHVVVLFPAWCCALSWEFWLSGGFFPDGKDQSPATHLSFLVLNLYLSSLCLEKFEFICMILIRRIEVLK